jgi:hypothetical protein
MKFGIKGHDLGTKLYLDEDKLMGLVLNHKGMEISDADMAAQFIAFHNLKGFELEECDSQENVEVLDTVKLDAVDKLLIDSENVGYQKEDLDKLSDSDILELCGIHNIDTSVRNTRQKQVNSLLKLDPSELKEIIELTDSAVQLSLPLEDGD